MSQHITITTDTGKDSVYVSAFKGILYSVIKNITITELHADIPMRDVKMAAFHVRYSYPHYPDDTLHIIDVDSSFVLHKNLLYTRVGKQHFLSLDNGVLSLIHPGMEMQVFQVKLPEEAGTLRYHKFAFAASHILNNTRTPDIFQPTISYRTYEIQLPKIIGNRITAEVVSIDIFGNCITSLSHDLLESHRKGRKVKVLLRWGESIDNIHESYYQVDDADYVCIVNSMGLMEIALKNANASQLLGIQLKSPVIFEFE